MDDVTVQNSFDEVLRARGVFATSDAGGTHTVWKLTERGALGVESWPSVGEAEVSARRYQGALDPVDVFGRHRLDPRRMPAPSSPSDHELRALRRAWEEHTS